MFAFAVWDQNTRNPFVARDRLGVKPLVYAATRRVRLRVHRWRAARGGFGGDIDQQADHRISRIRLRDRSALRLVGYPQTAAATILEYHAGQIRQRTYWTLPKSMRLRASPLTKPSKRPSACCAMPCASAFIADVPIGALLSGGVDSTLVCWAMRQANANIKAFTVAAPGDPSDESAAAAQTARKLGIRHTNSSTCRRRIFARRSHRRLERALQLPIRAGDALGLAHREAIRHGAPHRRWRRRRLPRLPVLPHRLARAAHGARPSTRFRRALERLALPRAAEQPRRADAQLCRLRHWRPRSPHPRAQRPAVLPAQIDPRPAPRSPRTAAPPDSRKP